MAIKAGEEFGKKLRNASSENPVVQSINQHSSNSSIFKNDSQSKNDLDKAKSLKAQKNTKKKK